MPGGEVAGKKWRDEMRQEVLCRKEVMAEGRPGRQIHDNKD